MLIYNNKISVCPLTTHLPLKIVPKKITKKLIENVTTKPIKNVKKKSTTKKKVTPVAKNVVEEVAETQENLESKKKKAAENIDKNIQDRKKRIYPVPEHLKDASLRGIDANVPIDTQMNNLRIS